MQGMQVRSLGQEDSPGEGDGYPLQHSCLGNPLGRGDWWTGVHRVSESRTQLSTSVLCSLAQVVLPHPNSDS